MFKKIVHLILCAGIFAGCASGSGEIQLSTPTVVSVAPTAILFFPTMTPANIPIATTLPTFTATVIASPIPSNTATSVPPSATLLKPTAPPVTPASIVPTQPTRPASVASTETLTRFFVDAAKHPKARCNDGTVPVFFFRRGIGDSVNKWVIYFKGGGNCTDQKSCELRDRSVTSSAPWQRKDLRELGDEEDRADGILSHNASHNPDFYNWNHVFLTYCSSDNWSGTRAASPATFNWHFVGHHITNAMIDALQDQNIVGAQNLANATQILFTGSSAGGAGLRNNLDRLAKQFTRADVRGVSDAGISQPVDSAIEAQYQQLKKAQWDLWQPVYDESCVAANAAQPWNCNDGDFLVSNDHIQTPLFIHSDQLDPLVLDAQGLNLRTRADRPKIEAFAAKIREILLNEPAVFSPFNNRHIILTNERFYEYKINGLTMFQVLGNWYFNRSGPKNVIEAPRPLR